MKNTMRILMASAAAVLVAAGTARAADTTWTNAAGGTFGTAGSWTNGVPGAADTARFNAGASYTVTFPSTGTSNANAYVTLGGQTVTWDLNNSVYHVLTSGPNIATTSDTGTLIITNGAVAGNYIYSGGWFNTGAGISVLLTNRGRITGPIPGKNSSLGIGGTLTTYGADSGAVSIDWNDINYLKSYNSSTNRFRSGYIVNAWIDNSVLQTMNGLVGGYGRAGTITVTNGGVITYSQTPDGATYLFGGQDDGYIWMNVGGGSDMTRTSLVEGTGFSFGRFDNASGSAHVNVFSNGMLRVTGNSHPISGSNYGTSDFKIQDQQALTLVGGSIQMTNASRMTLVDYRTAGSPGILRGYGSISRIGSGSFSIDNNGYIQPGDTGTNYNHNVAGLGTIAISNGSLYQTNSARDGRLYFEFSPTANDQINIQGGLARITAGSNFFALATGAPSPNHGEKYGVGVFDFLVATNITYTPAYDNLVNLLTNTYHLTYGVDFQYGVVSIGGGLFALELTFVPEPSTVMLLALGGLLVWRRIAKRSKK